MYKISQKYPNIRKLEIPEKFLNFKQHFSLQKSSFQFCDDY